MEIPSDQAQKFLNSSEAKLYNPLSYLIEPAKDTDVPNVYLNFECPYDFSHDKKTIIDIFGPSGAGKDTITRVPDPTIADVRIATSRLQREGESEDAYVWMRGKRDSETQDQYFDSLAEEYRLVSFAVENGILYGVPKVGLNEVKDARVTTIRMSARSINMLRENLGEEYNIVSLMVVPESFESLIPSIVNRGNVDHRLREVIENMKLGKKYANYFLLNKHVSGTEEEIQKAITMGKKSFTDFINSLK